MMGVAVLPTLAGCAEVLDDLFARKVETEEAVVTRDLEAVPRAADVNVIGLSPEETEALLGIPRSKRDEAPAKVWRYAASDCVVDIYFYLDVTKDRLSALNVAGAETRADSAETQDCLNRVRDGQQASRGE